MLIYWQRITEVYLKLGSAMKCHVLFKHCQQTYHCPEHKQSQSPQSDYRKGIQELTTMTGITLLQSCSVPRKMCIMHNSLGFFAPPVLLRDLSTPTISLSQLQRELQIESTPVTEYCIASHMHTQDIIS